MLVVEIWIHHILSCFCWCCEKKKEKKDGMFFVWGVWLENIRPSCCKEKRWNFLIMRNQTNLWRELAQNASWFFCCFFFFTSVNNFQRVHSPPIKNLNPQHNTYSTICWYSDHYWVMSPPLLLTWWESWHILLHKKTKRHVFFSEMKKDQILHSSYHRLLTIYPPSITSISQQSETLYMKPQNT